MTIDNYKFAGKKAIVRVDFNVPLDENGNITDDTRIRGALPTLKKILEEGGSLQDVAKYGMIEDCGLLVNSSRGIIYASNGEDFAEAAARESEKLANDMRELLKAHNII